MMSDRRRTSRAVFTVARHFSAVAAAAAAAVKLVPHRFCSSAIIRRHRRRHFDVDDDGWDRCRVHHYGRCDSVCC